MPKKSGRLFCRSRILPPPIPLGKNHFLLYTRGNNQTRGVFANKVYRKWTDHGPSLATVDLTLSVLKVGSSSEKRRSTLPNPSFTVFS